MLSMITNKKIIILRTRTKFWHVLRVLLVFVDTTYRAIIISRANFIYFLLGQSSLFLLIILLFLFLRCDFTIRIILLNSSLLSLFLLLIGFSNKARNKETICQIFSRYRSNKTVSEIWKKKVTEYWWSFFTISTPKNYCLFLTCISIDFSWNTSSLPCR